MSSLLPTLQMLKALTSMPETGKVVMLNLLKFKRDGRAAYKKYRSAVLPVLKKIGARPIFGANVTHSVIGHDGDWDAIALVEYPSRKAFAEMVVSAEYKAIQPLRDQGLERTEVYALTELDVTSDEGHV